MARAALAPVGPAVVLSAEGAVEIRQPVCGCVLIAVPLAAVVAAVSVEVPAVRAVAAPDAAHSAGTAGTAETDAVAVGPAEVVHRMSGALPVPVCEIAAARFANRVRSSYRILLCRYSGFHNKGNAWRILLLICLLCCQYIIENVEIPPLSNSPAFDTCPTYSLDCIQGAEQGQQPFRLPHVYPLETPSAK
jgi:hypothetical protein